LDKDTQRLNKGIQVFLVEASNVLTKHVTECGKTLTFIGTQCKIQ